MPDQAALLAHIVTQTRQNVEFLISQNEISRGDGQMILAKLPRAEDIALNQLSDQTRRLTIPEPGMPVAAVAVAPPARSVPLPSNVPRLQKAKALWAYNENGSELNDLSFRPGDIIEVVAESNADWWTGRANGREGLFPSNYVEKIDSAPAPQYSSQNAYSPPPPVQGYQVQQQPPPQQQVVVQEQEQKPSRMGKYGNLLATSAVGGVGFGAGSAIGSGIVNAIF
ncbi:SH3 domain-containing protein [Vararia minispora EC-137]|uniref:SH3 domain-containing protein n=1 Tax=Vararia minispora EC-137 TaxID=1314806 RepID=A0ACB8QB99_9AGAM|nr:SH3 domain-containing protein [Vararia minispora EC-137]